MRAAPVAGLAFLVLAVGCGGSQDAGAPPPVPVRVAVAELRDVPVTVTAVGQVEPVATVEVRARVEGTVAEVSFVEGQRVGRGDKLFLLDARPFEAALAQADATLARHRAEARQAAVEAARVGRLRGNGVSSADEYDRLKAHAEALEAEARGDEAQLARARLALEYATLTAPIDGRVGRALVTPGNVVKVHDTLLAIVHQTAPIDVAFAVPERELLRVRAAAAAGTVAVAVRPSGLPVAPLMGTLRFVDNAVERATATLALRASIPNADEALWPGQFVDVVMTLGVEANRITVPLPAVQPGQSGQLVYVVKPDRTVESRRVETGRVVDGAVVVTQGLEAGETVVTEGQLRLVPGTTVEVRTG